MRLLNSSQSYSSISGFQNERLRLRRGFLRSRKPRTPDSHHPAEMADEKDVEGCIDLIAEFLVSWEISGRKMGFGEPDKE